jgi:CRISPR/Cas system CSM-associated protein Csm4 (group 5 of RAMP superfamily)
MMEETFRPRGDLGIIKSDLKHIEFFDEDKFEENFEELTSEINAIEAESNIRFGK